MFEVAGKILIIGDKRIELEFSIKKVIVFDEVIIVLIYGDIIFPYNVITFDYNGNQLWEVNDIINVRRPTGNVDIAKKSENILSVYSSLNILFDIDVNKREIVNKTYLR